MPFSLLPLLITAFISFTMQVVGYLMIGRQKADKSESVRDWEMPTAEAGRPIPVVFGEIEITGINCLWYGEKSSQFFDKEIED